jgi:hypothetical protein
MVQRYRINEELASKVVIFFHPKSPLIYDMAPVEFSNLVGIARRAHYVLQGVPSRDLLPKENPVYTRTIGCTIQTMLSP